MKVPRTPDNEQARIDTLRSLCLLDTPSEERFDRITRMAKRLFDVPIALVSLVDENRQWFKSCIGLEVSETPRDISFCGHAILGSDLFIIPNVLEDERFADNPLVVNEPHIRFYAGCPLKGPDGQKMGTLCIIDQRPRKFTDDDLEALEDLSNMVERELAAVQLATLDQLTNISNRRGFIMLAQHSLHLCSRQHIPASLVFMDIDKLKPINDSFGHAEGDRALVIFAQKIASVCRESDVFARLGGDEFTVLLTNTSKARAEKIIARLQQSVSHYNDANDHGYDIEFSSGIVEYQPGSHPTVESMLADADSLMYKLKKSRSVQESARLRDA